MTRFTEWRGYSLLELMMVMALGVTVSAAAVPGFLATLDDVRASGATRHISGRFQRARMQAVMRSATVAIRFTQTSDGYSYAVYLDGNRNGVLTLDIQRGVDVPIAPPERLPEQFTGIEFGAIPGLPPIDSGGTPPGSDPIRLGAGSFASFTAMGTSSSGTVYIRSRRDAQYAVRIFGDTGKTRMLKFERRTRQWRPL
jgi:prepilin-type N-terminal cleavage/methylation domain-containing protein